MSCRGRAPGWFSEGIWEDAVTDQLRIKLSRAVRSGLPGLWGNRGYCNPDNQSLTFKFIVLGRKRSEV